MQEVLYFLFMMVENEPIKGDTKQLQIIPIFQQLKPRLDAQKVIYNLVNNVFKNSKHHINL